MAMEAEKSPDLPDVSGPSRRARAAGQSEARGAAA